MSNFGDVIIMAAERKPSSIPFVSKYIMPLVVMRWRELTLSRPSKFSWVTFLLSRSLLVSYLTSQLHANVSQGRICTDNFTCCHTEIEVTDQTFHFTQSQYTDTGPTSPSADPITPGAWQGSHWSANFEATGMTRPGKSRRKRDSNPGSSAPKAVALTTRPARRSFK